MKRKIIFIVAIMLILSMCTCIFTACPSNEPSDETPNKDASNSNLKHYEIQLSTSNFEDFLEYTVTEDPYIGQLTPVKDLYEVKGVLSYAYYKDVYVTFFVKYTVNGKTYKGDYKVKLNAAGNYSFYSNDEAVLKAIKCDSYAQRMEKSVTIKSVSGMVIFDI